MSEQTMAYMARKKCGCYVAATVDSPKWAKDVAKFIRECIADGLVIEHRPVEFAREHLRMCECAPKQLSLVD